MSEISKYVEHLKLEHNARTNTSALLDAEHARVVSSLHRLFEGRYSELSRYKFNHRDRSSVAMPALKDCLRADGIEVNLGDLHGVQIIVKKFFGMGSLVKTTEFTRDEADIEHVFDGYLTSHDGLDLRVARKDARVFALNAKIDPIKSIVTNDVLTPFIEAVARKIDLKADVLAAGVPKANLAIARVAFRFSGAPATNDCTVIADWDQPEEGSEAAVARDMVELMALQLYKSGDLYNPRTESFNPRIISAIDYVSNFAYQLIQQPVARERG